MSQTNLKLFTSNRFEILAKQLAGVVQTPLPTPFTPEIIVVQSRGMERWISMELARLNGISANCFFPFSQCLSGKYIQRTDTEFTRCFAL